VFVAAKVRSWREVKALVFESYELRAAKRAAPRE
jgi:hypothetical protein